MRCINCNSEISDGVSVCPVCNNSISVNNFSTPVPTNTSVLPTVPATPALPQDQAANFNATSTMGGNIDSNVFVQNAGNQKDNYEHLENSVVNALEGAQEANLQSFAVSENNSLPINNQINGEPTNQSVSTLNNMNQVNTTNVQTDISSVSSGQLNALVENNNSNNVQNVGYQLPDNELNQNLVSSTPQLTNDINPEFITPDGSLKIDNEIPLKEKKKINKKTIIIVAVIVVVLLVASIVGFLYYKSQYKSANERVTAVVSALTKGTQSLNNNVIEKTSGTYDVDLLVSSTAANLSAKVDGTYAVDLSAKAIDYTLNLSSLNLGEELVDNPINLEVYLNESRLYVLFQNYYENYIYDEVEVIKNIFDVNEQNNVDYMAIINALKSAIASGLKGMRSTQTVGEVTIHGVKKKTNIVKMNFNESNKRLFFRQAYKNLANNKKFVSEMSKFAGLSEEEYKNNLIKISENDNFATGAPDAVIEIYTAMFGKEFDGIKISTNVKEERGVIEIYPVSKGYGLSYKVGSQNVLDMTYEKAKKTTSTTRESTTKLGAIFYSKGNAFNIELSVNNIQDVNPKSAKVNVKNSINKKYLTEEDKQRILSSSQSAGKIGLYLPSIINAYLNNGKVTVNPDNNGEYSNPPEQEGQDMIEGAL